MIDFYVYIDLYFNLSEVVKEIEKWKMYVLLVIIIFSVWIGIYFIVKYYL